MKEYIIGGSDEGRRVDKFVFNILKEAPSSFVYKMMRKKNIVINDKKASGSEILQAGDTVKLYLSDETFDKFAGRVRTNGYNGSIPPIIYEDDDFLIINKPAGMLSQKSSADSVSLNEIMISYLLSGGKISEESMRIYTPSVCNRLDRNTSGLVTFARTYKGSKCLSEGFAGHTISKYYRCVVKGVVDTDIELTGSLIKDNNYNRVTVSKYGNEGKYIRTIVHPIRSDGAVSLLEIKLVTGKTHQIRAHLAAAGHPVIGDVKYGDAKTNDSYRKYGINCQMLSCTKMVFPEDFGLDVCGRTFEIDMPDNFSKVI